MSASGHEVIDEAQHEAFIAYYTQELRQFRVSPNFTPLVDHSFNPLTGMYVEEEEREEFLLDWCSQYMSAEDVRFVQRASRFALMAHALQVRKSGEPYSAHVQTVAIMIADHHSSDAVTIAAALLHDVLEDNQDISVPTIRDFFGQEVLDTILDVSKNEAAGSTSDEINEDARLRVIYALLSNPRAVMIKIYDRLYNMRQLDVMSPMSRSKNASETESIHVPLARVLGLVDAAHELEALSIMYTGATSRETIHRIEKDIEGIRIAHEQESENGGIELRLSGAFQQVFSLSPDDIYIRYASSAEVYRRGGSPYMEVRIGLPETQEDQLLQFKQQVMVFLAKRLGSDFSLLDDVTLNDIDHGITEDGDHVFSVRLQHHGSSLPLRVTIYPHDAFILDRASMADLYIPRYVQKDEDEESKDRAYRYQRALVKHEKLKSLLLEISQQFLGPPSSSVLVRHLERIQKPGLIWVIGEDDHAVRTRFLVPADYTLYDFAYFLHTDIGDEAIGAHYPLTRTDIDDLGMPLHTNDVVRILRGRPMVMPGDYDKVTTDKARTGIEATLGQRKKEPEVREAARVRGVQIVEWLYNTMHTRPLVIHVDYGFAGDLRLRHETLEDLYTAIGLIPLMSQRDDAFVSWEQSADEGVRDALALVGNLIRYRESCPTVHIYMQDRSGVSGFVSSRMATYGINMLDYRASVFPPGRGRAIHLAYICTHGPNNTLDILDTFRADFEKKYGDDAKITIDVPNDRKLWVLPDEFEV